MNKKKLNKQDFIFRNRKGETLTKRPGDINGIDFYIANLEECEVYLCDWMEQILIDDCKDCKIFLGPVVSSVFLRGSENILIAAASTQFRVSESKKVEAFVYVKSDPALENCQEISFAPYNFLYPRAREHFALANCDVKDPALNKWSQVYDFTPNHEKHNWGLLPPERFFLNRHSIEGFEDETLEEVVPVPRIYGGESDAQIIVGSQESKENTSDIYSFSINTTALEAETIVQKKEEEKEMRQAQNIQDIFDQETENGQSLKEEVQTSAMNLKIQERMNKEIEGKKQRQRNGQEDLKTWKKNYIEGIEERKRNNRLGKSLQNDPEAIAKSWATIGENISLKVGDHKGDKDINEMRQAILNKIGDERGTKN